MTTARRSRVTDEHLEIWRREGYVIVEGFLTDDEVAAGVAALHQKLPTAEQFAADPDAYADQKTLTWLDFPYDGDALNDVTLHPEMLSFVERALGTTDVVVSHSQILVKYGGTADFDQNLHLDYPNNTLAVPPHGRHEQTAAIVYYTDVTVDLGPTHVLSRAHSDHLPLMPSFHTRDELPELYEHEQPVVVPAGSVLLYGMRTFHRGSAFRASEGIRLSHHMSFQRKDVLWGGWRSFAMRGYDPVMHRFLERATPRQRDLLGFPAVGDPFWTPETIEAVALRYPGMDVSPYR